VLGPFEFWGDPKFLDTAAKAMFDIMTTDAKLFNSWDGRQRFMIAHKNDYPSTNPSNRTSVMTDAQLRWGPPGVLTIMLFLWYSSKPLSYIQRIEGVRDRLDECGIRGSAVVDAFFPGWSRGAITDTEELGNIGIVNNTDPENRESDS
jgi:hypothetical protein